MTQIQKDRCEQQGKRDGDRNDQGRANIAKEKKQDDRNQEIPTPRLWSTVCNV